jgi:DNA-directed RNA polymerase specialized sigma24 family protein
MPSLRADNLNQEQFDQLLLWLNPDREQAAQQYESIRRRLIKIFVCRGAHTPEELADDTINRVARKLPEIRNGYVGEPAHYFCGVAGFIWQESLRKERLTVVAPPVPALATEEEERDYACLEKCLSKLSKVDRELAIAYYQQEKNAKIDNRKQLAEQMGLAMNALRLRAFRIRATLFKCVEGCRARLDDKR